MTPEEKRAYARGYQRGGHQWPAHRPPAPPQAEVAGLMRALKELRDECDSMCATLCDDDDFVVRLAPRIDAADQAMEAVSKWLKDAPCDTMPEMP